MSSLIRMKNTGLITKPYETLFPIIFYAETMLFIPNICFLVNF